MSDQNPTKTEHSGRPGHRRLGDRILDAMDQAEGQGRTDVAERLCRIYTMLVEQEAIQYADRRQ